MKIKYDDQTDSLYIDLVDRESVESRELADGLIVDFDAEGRVVGLDIQNAGSTLDLSTLETTCLPHRQFRAAS